MEALHEWSSASMKEWLKSNEKKVSGTKQERFDRIVGNMSIEEAPALAS